MLRASAVLESGFVPPEKVVDRVVLDADERHRRRIVLTGERGTQFLLDLDHAVALKDGDGLVLDDGTVVRVAGKPEALVEIEAKSPLDLARLAWHLGNRHTAVQILDGKLRIRRDHVLEQMVAGLGGKFCAIEAPFEPETGAHSHAGGEHAHEEHAQGEHAHGDHAHDHDHAHADHATNPDHEHGT
jgi:urease accessory protein